MATQKKFEHKGKTYYSIKSGHKVKVTTEKTATGQMINLGCYDIVTNTWQSNNRNYPIPHMVKKGVEIAFGESKDCPAST